MIKLKLLKNILVYFVICFTLMALFACKKDFKIEKSTDNEQEKNIPSELNIVQFEYDILDLNEAYDDETIITIDFNKGTEPDGFESLVRDEGDNVIIKSGATYRFTGMLKNKRIWVEKGTNENVSLILDGLKIDTDKYSAIRVVDDVIAKIILSDGSENEINLSVQGNPKQDAIHPTCIFSRNALTFNGKGKLILNSNSNSISSIESDDKVVFIRGDYSFNAKGDSIKAKNAVVFREGNFSINSIDDAIKVKNNDGGFIYVDNATLNIKSGDKGIVSDDKVIVLGGNTYIDSAGESISGKTIDILGGNISLKSGDDAINSTDGDQNKKSNQVGVYTRIAGGTLDIDATMDGIDSNGDLHLEGGNIFINGAENDNERIIDYNGIVTCGNGLRFCGVGPGAKMQDFGDSTMENYLVVYFKDLMIPSDNIRITDENEENILVFSATKSYKAALIALKDIKEGNKYRLTAGNKTFDFTVIKGRNEIRE